MFDDSALDCFSYSEIIVALMVARYRYRDATWCSEGHLAIDPVNGGLYELRSLAESVDWPIGAMCATVRIEEVGYEPGCPFSILSK